MLPGDDVQHLLFGVSIIQDGFLEHQFFLQILFIEISLVGDSNDVTSISGQSNTGALHLEKTVINLKMDALRM